MNEPFNLKKYHVYIAAASLLMTIVIQLTSMAVYANTVEIMAKTNKEHIRKHIEDISVHMPLEKKIEMFPMRTEFDDMKDDIKEIKKDIKQLLNKR